MEYSGPSLSIHIKIAVEPFNRDAFLEALRPVYEACVAEPLNTFFEVYEDAATPGVFKLVETWNATEEYMEEIQKKKPYYGPYFEAAQPMLIRPVEIEVYNRMPRNRWVSLKKDFFPG